MMATSDETNDDEFKTQDTRGEPPPSQSFFSTMNSYAREFIFVLAVAFTAIAALQNGYTNITPLKTRKTHPPVPFFPEPSLVTDFHEGEIGDLTQLLLEKDVCLVMYYAPWDAQSINAKKEYEKVAKFYHHEVFFAAINCWWPDGDCSQKYKIPAFPIVLVYVHDVGSIRYNGPLVANYIIAFLDNVLSPIVTLQHAGELLDLQTRHEGVLVGSFEFSGGVPPKGYSIFYTSSLLALSRDPNRKLCFAVITNSKVRLKFQLKSSLQLFLWNRTEVYTANTFSAHQIIDWVFAKLEQTSQWITPPGTKSTLLTEIVERAATIIMFTPRSLLLQSTPYYDLFREVALDYNNCNSSAQVTSLIHRVVLQRHILQESITKLLNKCELTTLNTAQDVTFKKRNICDLTCCQSLSVKLRLSKSKQCFCRACIHHIVQSEETMKLGECEKTLELILKGLEITKFPFTFYDSCNMVEASYPIKFGAYHRLSLKCEDEVPSVVPSRLALPPISYSEVKDDHIATMAKNMEKSECNRLKFGLNYSDINFPEFPASGLTNWQTNFTGLGCRTNRSLLFVAMDTVLFHPFAESLGVDIFNTYHQSAAIIVDGKQESSYLLDGNINKRSLVEFIKNYTLGTLGRFLRSTVHKLEGCPTEKGNFCLKELTTATFMDYVMDNESDVVLMYYAPGCAACSSVFHIFLGVANYFSNIKKVKFARISGDDHDLPWEYTVEKYPTIIFFPAQRKEDSVEFPSHLPISSTNLLHFVLVNSQPKVRWVIAMRMCNRECVAHNLAKSSTELRRLFRELHITINELYFYRHIEKNKPKSKFKKFIKIQTEKKKEPFSFANYLINRIRRKRNKIDQAYQLLNLLRRKRDMYLKDVNFTSRDSIKPEADMKVAFQESSSDRTSSKFDKKKLKKDEL